jgi:hypothetical protein
MISRVFNLFVADRKTHRVSILTEEGIWKNHDVRALAASSSASSDPLPSLQNSTINRQQIILLFESILKANADAQFQFLSRRIFEFHLENGWSSEWL